MEEEDKIIGAYQSCLSGRTGEIVMLDLKRLCRSDQVMIDSPVPTDRELLVHATLRDLYEYIYSMVNHQGEQ